MIIIGIDPGFAITGFGVLKYEMNRFEVIDFGVIETSSSMPLADRLLTLSCRLEDLFEKYKPDAASVEELFFSKNTKTALNVGHGRGVVLLAAARAGLQVSEYTPLQVKQAVSGYGRAEKQQMQQMVKILLNLREVPKPDDAADALAVAICHAHSCKIDMYKIKAGVSDLCRNDSARNNSTRNNSARNNSGRI